MSDALHPQEIDVVWRGHTGVAIPSREYGKLRDEAGRLGLAYEVALYTQVARQTVARCGVLAERSDATPAVPSLPSLSPES